MLISKYVFGETAVYYVKSRVEGLDGAYTVGLAIYPESIEIADVDALCADSLVQVAFAGSRSLVDYSQGLTMRNRASSVLNMVGQISNGNSVVTELTDGEGNYYSHTLTYHAESGVFAIETQYENRSDEVRALEMLSSFSVSGIINPSMPTPTTAYLKLHRMTSAWSRECRLQSLPFSALGFDMSWAHYGVKSEKFGCRGNMPVYNYFPFAAVEDERGGTIWAVTLQAPYSWQIELYQEKESCALSGGPGDYEFAMWRKIIPPRGKFKTHSAYFTVKSGGGVNACCNAFLKYEESLLRLPESEKQAPVIYNEYCKTWGVPSEESVLADLEDLKGLGVGYYVVDAGWYKPEGAEWTNSAGDWNVNETQFPHGLKYIVQKINQSGMKAGIWFEAEVACRDSQTFNKKDFLLTRDGAVLTCKNRRFLDLRKEEVRRSIEEKILSRLCGDGFEYIKIDHNDTVGFGCDGGDSPGEGGREMAEQSLALIGQLKDKAKGLVVENCSSGGGRIEPLRMSLVSMCSFSDAHECAEIPLVAANVSRVVPARQNQIWATIREGDCEARIIYSLTAAMIGRICLSGDIAKLYKPKLALIKQGLDFYNEAKEIVINGEISDIDCDVEYYRYPAGRQIYVKKYLNRKLVIVHRLQSEQSIALDMRGYSLEKAYTSMPHSEKEGFLILGGGKQEGGAFIMKKNER